MMQFLAINQPSKLQIYVMVISNKISRGFNHMSKKNLRAIPSMFSYKKLPHKLLCQTLTCNRKYFHCDNNGRSFCVSDASRGVGCLPAPTDIRVQDISAWTSMLLSASIFTTNNKIPNKNLLYDTFEIVGFHQICKKDLKPINLLRRF